MIIYRSAGLQIIEANSAALNFYGYSLEEMKKQTVSSIRIEQEHDKFKDLLPKIHNQENIQVETIHRTKNGDIRNVQVVSFPIGYLGNEARLAQIHDISDKVRQAKNLELILATNQFVAENLDLQVILQRVTDVTTELSGAEFGAFFYNTVNEQGEAMMLYTLSGADKSFFENLGMPKHTSIFHPSMVEAKILRIEDVTQDPRYGKSAPHYGMPKGHLPVASYMSVPIVSQSAEIHGCLLFGHKRKGVFSKESEDLVSGVASQAAIALDHAKLFEEVTGLNTKKDVFFNVASHELKTPITSIQASLQLIERLYKANPQSATIEKLISKSIGSVSKLSNLIRDLLDVSRIEKGQLAIKKSVFKFSDVIDNCCHHINNIGQQALRIEGDLELEVYGDAVRIEQVLVNFVTNAVKYAPESDEIIVKIERIEDKAKVSVSDKGKGIPKERIAKIFDRYYRADPGSHESGMGLGLFISSEIVKQHDGEIGVESKIGQGTTFWFTIPI